MPPLTIDLDEQASGLLLEAAKRDGASSLSQWAREKLLQAAGTSTGWPPGYAALIGSLQDDTFQAPEDHAPEQMPSFSPSRA